ncbi:MAG: hypothetical protein OEU26_16235 [Candidatus Tectomicrobia bacterium]|nr:hypothetical protein [Candidatus Tectomicrobia bacterium]
MTEQFGAAVTPDWQPANGTGLVGVSKARQPDGAGLPESYFLVALAQPGAARASQAVLLEQSVPVMATD